MQWICFFWPHHATKICLNILWACATLTMISTVSCILSIHFTIIFYVRMVHTLPALPWKESNYTHHDLQCKRYMITSQNWQAHATKQIHLNSAVKVMHDVRYLVANLSLKMFGCLLKLVEHFKLHSNRTVKVNITLDVGLLPQIWDKWCLLTVKL